MMPRHGMGQVLTQRIFVNVIDNLSQGLGKDRAYLWAPW